MRPLLAAFCLFLVVPAAFAAGGALAVRNAGKGRVDVDCRKASLTAAMAALEPYLGRPVALQFVGDRSVDCALRGQFPDEAARSIAAAAGLKVTDEAGSLLVRDPQEPTLTLDAREMEVREIFREIGRQCGIRNLMIDPDVAGKGTFLFHDVPCGTAIRSVLQSLGLGGELYPNSVLRVGRDH